MINAVAWLILFVFLVIVEGSTMQLVSIWFACGSVAAFFASILGADFVIQLALFVIVSILLLLAVKPLARKHMSTHYTPTNVEAMAGQMGIVKEVIVPGYTGIVTINGQDWTAVAEDPTAVLEKGCEVTVVKVRGVKVIVK